MTYTGDTITLPTQRVRADGINPDRTGLPPFARITGWNTSADGLHHSADGWTYYHATNTQAVHVYDDTGHISIGEDLTHGAWTIRIDITAVYEFGLTVFWDATGNTGDRYLGIAEVSGEDDYLNNEHHLGTVPSANANTTVTAIAPIHAPAGTYWWPMFGDDTGGLAAGVAAFWARAVSYNPPHYLNA